MKDTRSIYNVAISFDMPMEGVVPLAATSEEHAREIIDKMFKNRRNVVVHDVYDTADAPGIEDFMDKDDDGNTRTIN